MIKKLLFVSLLLLSVSMYAENDSLSIEHKIDSLVRIYYDSLSNNSIFDTTKITVLENGNVGIDTTNPNYKLEVNGDIKGTKIIGLEAWSIQPKENWPTSFNLSNNTGFWHMTAPRIWDSYGNVVPNYMGIYWASQQETNTTYKNIMSLQGTGNVGIGTESPTVKLDVIGKNQGTELWGYDRRTDYPSSINLKNNNGFWHISGPRSYESGNLAFYWVTGQTEKNYNYNKALSIEKSGDIVFGKGITKASIGSCYGSEMNWGTSYIGFNATRKNSRWIFDGDGANNGGVVIYSTIGGNIYFSTIASSGASTATYADEDIVDKANLIIKSNGVVLAKEVQVTLDGWPDYVFYNEYNLPKLSEVEEFVNENSHLPNVPSVATVTEEGVSLGEMNKILLQKVEELTLYIIEQQKQIEDIKAEMNSSK